jgi:hypothetical protein
MQKNVSVCESASYHMGHIFSAGQVLGWNEPNGNSLCGVRVLLCAVHDKIVALSHVLIHR